jgi:hypothetical protein
LGAFTQLLTMVPWAISSRSTISNIGNSPQFGKNFPQTIVMEGGPKSSLPV